MAVRGIPSRSSTSNRSSTFVPTAEPAGPRTRARGEGRSSASKKCELRLPSDSSFLEEVWVAIQHRGRVVSLLFEINSLKGMQVEVRPPSGGECGSVPPLPRPSPPFINGGEGDGSGGLRRLVVVSCRGALTERVRASRQRCPTMIWVSAFLCGVAGEGLVREAKAGC